MKSHNLFICQISWLTWIMFCTLTLWMTTANAQQGLVSNPSAEGAALARAINTPVNYYTGVVSVDIPLFNINSKGIEVPINLVNQCSGIKKNDEATWVGLGWRLSAGGQITRIVRGKPDDLFYSSDVKLRGYPDARPMSKIDGYGAIQNALTNNYDGEPDLFYFEIPGASGMFVCDSSGVAHTIPFQPIEIEWVDRNYFVITDTKGNEYYLGSKESSKESTYTKTSHYKMIVGMPGVVWTEEYTYTSTWKLDRIITPLRHQVTFTYVPDPVTHEKSIRNTYLHYKIGVSGSDPERLFLNDEFNDITTKQYVKNLKEIVWDVGRMTFITTKDRTDYAGAARLSEIRLYSQHDDYRYSIVINSKSVGSPWNCHTISSIDRKSGNSQHQLYSFDYYPCNYSDSRDGTDFWGYYNDTDGSFTSPPCYSIYGMAVYPDDKPINLSSTRWNTLHRIIYPNGGCKEFDYELNEGYGYDYSSAWTLSPSGGLRIKSIMEKISASESDGKLTTYQYVQEDDTTSSGLRYEGVPIGGSILSIVNNYTNYLVPTTADQFVFDLTGVSTGYARVKETKPNGGYTIYNFTNFESDPDIKEEVHSYHPTLAPLDYRDPFHIVPVTSYAYKRGLLTEKSVYDSNSQLVAQEKYTYSFDKETIKSRVPAYLVFSMPTAQAQQPRLCLGTYYWVSQPIKLVKSEIMAGPYHQNSIVEYEYDPTYNLPTKLKNTDKEGNVTETVTVYPFQLPQKGTYPTMPGTSQVKAISFMTYKRMLSVPVEQIIYVNGKVTKADLYVYDLVYHGKDTSVILSHTRQLAISSPIPDNQFVKSTIQGDEIAKLVYDSHYILKDSILSYDNDFQILSSKPGNDNVRSIIYGYNNSQPVAVVQNAARAGYGLSYMLRAPSLTASLTTKTTSVDIPFPQKVRLEVQHSFFGGEPTAAIPILLKINNATTGEDKVQIVRYIYQKSYPGTSSYIFEVYLEAGSYTFSYESDSYYGQYMQSIGSCPQVINLTCYYLTIDHENTPQQTMSYTSFEEEMEDGFEYADAKSGRKVYAGSYGVPLNNFAPGTYVLSYWMKITTGDKWTYHEQLITLPTSSISGIWVGASNTYIDEVRVYPQGATMTTATYLLGVGKISESDENGRTVHYEYDEFGNLKAIRDNDRNLIESHEYHYAK